MGNPFSITALILILFTLGGCAGKETLPTATRVPTYTQLPTLTPYPTYTPYPSSTPFPTYTPEPTLPPKIVSILYTPSPTPLTSVAKRLDYPFNKIAEKYPRVDGSTSTGPLQWTIICKIYDLDYYWESSYGSLQYIQVMDFYEQTLSEQIIPRDALPPVEQSGTHAAYMNLIDGKTDFILEARLPSASELAAAEAKGVKLDAQPVALDAFVFLAHADNPVSSLNLAQIRAIYSGQITNWKEVGGLDEPISAYQREADSGSQELMKLLVMHETAMIDAPDMLVYTMAGPFNAIQGNGSDYAKSDPNGIGYSVYYYSWYIMRLGEDIKFLNIDGIRPTSKTIANRTYPLVSEVYAVIRQGLPSDAPALLLRDWLLTQSGQYAVINSGYVPILKGK